MVSKYYKVMSEIKASEDLKERIKASMEKENIKSAKKVGLTIKIKKTLIAISATVATLLCGGVVYATLGGTINGVPVVEWLGIKFSQNYTQYEEKVKNKYIENEYGKIEVQSTVSDDGFTIIKFNLKFSDKLKKQFDLNTNEDDWSKLHFRPFDALSLNNDIYQAENRNIMIDGKKYEVNGNVQSIEEVIKNQEYNIYQMWFLTDEVLQNKNEFKLTINNMILGDYVYFQGNENKKFIEEDGHEYASDEWTNSENWQIKFRGSIDIQLSKIKAKENTKIINGNNEKISYKKMEKTIDEVKVTPLQNIVKLSNIINITDANSLVNLQHEDYIGETKYIVYDQNGKELRSYCIETKKEIMYPNGKRENMEDVGLYDENSNIKNISKILSNEYLAIEENENITELNIEVYETNEYYSKTKNIGNFHIDLNNSKIDAENKNVDMSKKQENDNIESNENNTIIKQVESTNTDWEQYPEDMEKGIIKVIGNDDTPVSDELGVRTQKIIYSLYHNQYDEEELMTILNNIWYFKIGDAGGIYEVDSNYEQYRFPVATEKVNRYNNIIKIKTAIFGENYYDYEDYLSNISEKVKKQYEKIRAENYNQNKEYYFEIDKMVIMNGNNANEADFRNNARAKKIKVNVNNDKDYIIELKDTNRAQVFNIDYKQNGIEKPIDVSVEVLEAYSGDKIQDIYISDIQFGVNTNVSLGR